MGLIGFIVEGAPLSFDDALLAALRGEAGGMGLPMLASIVAGVRGKDRPPPSAGFSASQFQSCPRKIILEATQDYYDLPERWYAMTRGTLVHKILEDALGQYPPHLHGFFHTEERLHAILPVTHGGKLYTVPIHGQFDLAYLPNTDPATWPPHPALADPRYRASWLYDHKNTAWMPSQAKEEHIWQTSIYAWLMAMNGWEAPTRARIEYMDARENREYEVALFHPFEVEEYLSAAIAPLVAARIDGHLPDRVGKEGRWACGENRTNTAYCPFSARCWPAGIGAAADGWPEWLSTAEHDLLRPVDGEAG